MAPVRLPARGHEQAVQAGLRQPGEARIGQAVAGVGLQQMQGIVEWGMEGREGGPVMRADRAGRIGRAGFEEHHRQFLVSVGKPCGRRLQVDRRDGFAGRLDCMNSISARQLT